MIDELRYHDPAKQQIISRETARAAADEIERLRLTLTIAHGMIHRQRHALHNHVDEALRELNDVAQSCWEISHPPTGDAAE